MRADYRTRPAVAHNFELNERSVQESAGVGRIVNPRYVDYIVHQGLEPVPRITDRKGGSLVERHFGRGKRLRAQLILEPHKGDRVQTAVRQYSGNEKDTDAPSPGLRARDSCCNEVEFIRIRTEPFLTGDGPGPVSSRSSDRLDRANI